MRQQNVTDDSLIRTVAEVNEQELGLWIGVIEVNIQE